jgi:transposase
MLIRSHHGARGVWHVVHVPSREAEDRRHRHRDLETVQQERASTTARIKGLLRSQGIRLTSVTKLPEPRDALRLWDGSPMPSGLRQRVLRVYAPYTFLRAPIAALEAERRARLQSAQDANLEKGRQVMQRKGLGSKGAWVLIRELFGWRALQTRREVGG